MSSLEKYKTTDNKVLRLLTLLSLVEHWRSRMVDALLVCVGELLPASLVDTLGCHFVRFAWPQLIARRKMGQILEQELNSWPAFSSGCFNRIANQSKWGLARKARRFHRVGEKKHPDLAH